MINNCENLEKRFTAPKTISPFYGNDVRIPRKLKKRIKVFCGVHWELSTNKQRLWHYLEKRNSDYKRYLIRKVCNNSNVD